MENIWIFAAILAVAFYAVSNIFDKILRDRYVKSTYGLTILFLIKNVVFLIFLPFIDLHSLTPIYFGLIIAAGIFWLFTVITYVHALSMEEVSRVVPIWNIYPIFTLLLSAIFLQEQLTVLDYAAFSLLLMGGIVLSIHDLKNIRLSTAFWLMVASAASFSIYAIILKYLLTRMDFWNVFVLISISGGAIGMLLLIFEKPRKEAIEGLHGLKHGGLIPFICGGLVGYAGVLLYNFSVHGGKVSIVASLDGFQSLFLFIFIAILSAFFPNIFREEITKEIIITKLIALGLMCTGLFLLYS